MQTASVLTSSGADYRVMLVEDDLRLSELISDYLEKHNIEVMQEMSGSQAIEQIQLHNPHLVVLDVMLPGKDGFEICRELRARGSTLPILMLTARDEDFDRVLGLELGADDFLPKPVQPRVLLAHIRAILRRTHYAVPTTGEPTVLIFGKLRIDQASREASIDDIPVDISTSEFDLLWLLAKHAGKVLTRNDILMSLRSLDYDGADRSVDSRICRLRKKLGDLSNSGEKIKTVRGVGYLFSPTQW